MYLGAWAAGSATIAAIQKISPMLEAESTLGALMGAVWAAGVSRVAAERRFGVGAAGATGTAVWAALNAFLSVGGQVRTYRMLLKLVCR